MIRLFLFGTLMPVLWISCNQSTVTDSTIKDQVEVFEIDPLFASKNLVAWCVVPFDSMQRTPKERAVLLRELGFTKMAYDWRDKHLPTFPEEVKALEENQIELTAVWWWIDGQSDSLLNSGNEQLLHYLDSLNLNCDIWMSFDDRFFEGLNDEMKLAKTVESVKYLHGRAAAVGSKLQLYNHGAWFGDPRNQVQVIEQSGLTDIGIIYSFHHGHEQIDEFPGLLKMMMPYLNTVNINGMRKEGPQILPVGAGDQEQQMLRVLKDSGYQGSIGIIGHQEDKDVAVVLEKNLKGLHAIATALQSTND